MAPIEPLDPKADLSLREMEYTETREGVPRWTLKADAASHRSEGGATRIENVRMIFYDVADLGDLTLTAREGLIDEPAGEIVAQGDVVIRSPRGYAFFTDRLRYQNSANLILTEEPVRMESQTMEVVGRGMRLDLADRSLEIFSEVQATIDGSERAGGRS